MTVLELIAKTIWASGRGEDASYRREYARLMPIAAKAQKVSLVKFCRRQDCWRDGALESLPGFGPSWEQSVDLAKGIMNGGMRKSHAEGTESTEGAGKKRRKA